MKRFTVFLLILCMFSVPASANSWGLKGGALYQAVSSVHTWDDYSVIGAQCGNFAVMGSHYHNALFFADPEEGLCVYHTAVWQPEDRVSQSLRSAGSGFVLTAGAESFTFSLINGRYMLIGAQLGGVSVRADGVGASSGEPRGYRFSDGGRSVRWLAVPLLLEDFNIRLFPRSAEEVLNGNLLRASLESGRQCLEYREDWRQVKSAGKGTAPVFSAPFGDSAWRAAKGKAAVSLKEPFRTLRGFTNAYGEAWTCVLYEVSERTARIGWVKNGQLGSAALSDPADETAVRLLNTDVRARCSTFLTDDPFVSQFAQFSVPEGTDFNCMGLLGNDWAYVSAEVTDHGTFTDGGAVVWGFVPLRDLAPVPGDVQYDVMGQLEGQWYFSAGGSMAEDALILHADGTYESACEVYTENGDIAGLCPSGSGSWYVTKYSGFGNKYWNPAEYEITFLREDGTANVKALTLNENGFSLTDAEGGGGYERVYGNLFESVPELNR